MPESLEDMPESDREMLARRAPNISLARKVFDFLRFGNIDYKGKFVIVYDSEADILPTFEDAQEKLREVLDHGIHFVQPGIEGNFKLIYNGKYKMFDSRDELDEFKKSLDKRTAEASYSSDTSDVPGMIQ